MENHLKFKTGKMENSNQIVIKNVKQQLRSQLLCTTCHKFINKGANWEQNYKYKTTNYRK